MSSMQWVTEKIKKFYVEKNQLSNGALRNAFKATDVADGSEWVIKKYIPKAVKTMEGLRHDSRRSCTLIWPNLVIIALICNTYPNF